MTTCALGPKVLAKKDQPLPERIKKAGGFDYPATLLGASTWRGEDGKPVSVYYDPNVRGAKDVAAYILTKIDDLMNSCDFWFGVKGDGGNVIVSPDFGGAYHYGCLLPGQVLEGAVIGGSKAHYSGTAIEVTTAGGVRLSVTPNHPVLTSRGFVAAGQLKEGDDLLQHIGESEFPGRADDEENAPALVEEAFDSFNSITGSIAILDAPAIPLDFHGDAMGFEGEIQVVGTYCDLARHRVTDAAESGDEGIFSRGGVQQATLPRRRASQQLVLGRPSSESGLMSGPDLLPPGFGAHALPHEQARFGPASRLDTSFAKPRDHRSGADANFASQLLRRLSSQVTLAKITQVRRFHYDGPVYDFESPIGWILVNGICTSNCTFADGGDWYESISGNQTTLGLVMAEVTESYMGKQGKGWNCGGSGGEGLSRVLASIATGGADGAMKDYSAGPSWNGSNWIARDSGTDQDYPSTGCAVLYLWWMLKQGYSMEKIVQAGEPNGALNSNYQVLTGKSSGQAFSDFVAAVNAVGGPGGFSTDNPFGATTPPYPAVAVPPVPPVPPSPPSPPPPPVPPPVQPLVARVAAIPAVPFSLKLFGLIPISGTIGPVAGQDAPVVPGMARRIPSGFFGWLKFLGDIGKLAFDAASGNVATLIADVEQLVADWNGEPPTPPAWVEASLPAGLLADIAQLFADVRARNLGAVLGDLLRIAADLGIVV